jgi:hypothetical protein
MFVLEVYYRIKIRCNMLHLLTQILHLPEYDVNKIFSLTKVINYRYLRLSSFW